ncbi:unnamed protein product, partial [Ixodes pacificus]
MKTDKTVVKRRVLNEVQPTAYNQRLLVGASGIMRMDLKKESSNKRKQAFDVENESEVSSKKLATRNDDSVPTKAEVTDRNASSNAYDLLVKDEVPIQYWKELAEQRRIALEKALQENEEVSVLVWFALICCWHSHNTFLVFLSAPRTSRTAHRREQA